MTLSLVVSLCNTNRANMSVVLCRDLVGHRDSGRAIQLIFHHRWASIEWAWCWTWLLQVMCTRPG
jgi:oligoribonuclease NrnB/cAMP/cGMP phosphodiesterase (DHH superfamily)